MADGCSKRLGVPMLGSKLGCFVATAKWRMDEVSRCLKPHFHIGFEFRKGGAEMMALNTVKLKPKLMFMKHLGIQVGAGCTSGPGGRGLHGMGLGAKASLCLPYAMAWTSI